MRTTDRFGSILDAVLTVLALGALVSGCNRGSSTAEAPAPTPAPAVAGPSAASGPGRDPALEQLAKAGYVGNSACVDCHADIAETFARSAMARSIRPAGRWPEGVTEDKRLGLALRGRVGRGAARGSNRRGGQGRGQGRASRSPGDGVGARGLVRRDTVRTRARAREAR